MMFAFVGPGVEELIHSAAIAMAGQVPIGRLWHAVPLLPLHQRSLAPPAGGLLRPTRRLK